MSCFALLSGVTLALICSMVPLAGQSQPPPSAALVPDAQQGYVFSGGAGMLFFHVRPDRAADFEAVSSRLSALLAASEDPVRRLQADSWKMFRSVESHPNRIYVFVFDPVAAGADYDPVRILREEAPDEVQALYLQLKESIVRIERMGLEPIKS